MSFKLTGFWPVSVIVVIAFAGVLAGIPLVTIDHDEGFFFQTAQSAVSTGRFSFPWTEELLWKGHFIPLNSLLPLILSATVPLGENSLWTGRVLSSLAFLAGLLALARLVYMKSSNRTQGGLALVLVATALPLWQYARVIRPESYVFMFSCLVIYVAIMHPRRHAWLLGVLSGLACLAHGVHGLFVALLACTLLVSQFGTPIRVVLPHIAGLLAGFLVVIGAFYVWYGVAPEELMQQITLFAKITPNVASPDNPLEQLIRWLHSLGRQLQEVPMIIMAGICFINRKTQVRSSAALAMEVIIFIFYLAISCFYPKKTMSSVCVVLPAVIGWLVLTDVPKNIACGRSIGRVLLLVLGLNGLLSFRYHWRLITIQDNALEQTNQLANALKAQSGKNDLVVLAKLWMAFSLSSKDRLFDITILPVAGSYFPGKEPMMERMLNEVEAVIIEVQPDGNAVDTIQAEVLKRFKQKGWVESHQALTRLFAKQDCLLLVPPADSKRTTPQVSDKYIP